MALATKILLVILDGWGWSPIPHGNLLLETPTPHLDTLLGLGGWLLLKPASLEVGLPWGSVGDSELGHYNLGTGRIIIRRGGESRELIAVPDRAAFVHADQPTAPAGTPLVAPMTIEAPVVSLGTVLAGYGIRQAKIATASKLPLLQHAMNGYPSLPLTGETAVAVADEGAVTATLTKTEDLLAHEFLAINFASADLAAHRGDLRAAREAIVTIDDQLGRLYELARQHQAVLYLAADHGNIEQMLTEHGRIEGGHTTGPVLLARLDPRRRRITPIWAEHPRKKSDVGLNTPTGLLADIAPTLLADFGLPIPASMVGVSLLRELASHA